MQKIIRCRNIIYKTVLSVLFLGELPLHAQFVPDEWSIPANGNSYITKINLEKNFQGKGKPLAFVSRAGIILKNDTLSVASTYIYIPGPGTPQLLLNMVGVARIAVTCGDQHFLTDVDQEKFSLVDVGQLNITEPQYIKIDFQIRNNGQPSYLVIRNIVLTGISTKPLFINNNFNTTFGLRGPSIHLVYDTGDMKDAEWMYNEVTIPTDGDIPGSDYCAIGFDGGYLGLQDMGVNDRHILFSVWNALNTDTPGTVQPGYATTVQEKSDEVEIMDFGNEVSGKQGILKYSWEAGQTYRFLVHAEHPDSSSTDYTAYFYHPTEEKWLKMATFRRPHTGILLRGLCSFVDNLDPHQGYVARKGYFGNFWVKSRSDSLWQPLQRATLNADETARRGVRVDYEGGVEGARFYLKMGGYFGNGSKQDRQLLLPELTGKEKQEKRKNFTDNFNKEFDTQH